VVIALRYIDPTGKEDKSACSDFTCGKDTSARGVGSALPKPSDAPISEASSTGNI